MTETKILEMDQLFSSTSKQQNRTSSLIMDLIKTLNDKGLPYCHWKSNLSLEKSLSGEIDLDLFVDRKYLSHALAVLHDFDFKQAMIKWGKRDPAIYHYYGMDPETGRLIHVHLFSSVLTGESFLKSHLFPFEKMLLENRRDLSGIKTTSKAAELVIFILRTFIKYGSLIDLFYLRNSKNELKEELEWLRSENSQDIAVQLLQNYCPVIDKNLFLKCINMLSSDTSLLNRISLARKVRRCLRIYIRFSGYQRFKLYLVILAQFAWHRLLKHNKNKMLCSGGAIIAFVGPEATGKSTLVTESKRWLNENFSVKNIHAGKPPSALLTWPVNVFVPFLRNLIPGARTTRQEGHVSTGKDEDSRSSKHQGPTSLLYAVRSVTLAWDRRRLLLKARKLSANGDLVICDRYPSSTTGAMDSPRLKEIKNLTGLKTSLFNRLARIETRLYNQIPPPDLVLQLTVSIETAKQRNRDRIKTGKESDAYLISRHLQSKNWQMPGKTEIRIIDTEKPLDQTILLVKKSIWQAL
jgi:thymidylate kinase